MSYTEENSYRLLKEISKHSKKAFIDINKVGRYLGSGGEGFVYGYGRGRALKINLNTYEGDKEEIERALRWVVETKPIVVARVYRYGWLREGLWWIEMERLRQLEGRECDKFSEYVGKYYHKKKDARILRPRTEIGKRRREFLIGIREIREKYKLYHNDVLGINVMKDRLGRWKLIDVESFCEE